MLDWKTVQNSYTNKTHVSSKRVWALSAYDVIVMYDVIER